MGITRAAVAAPTRGLDEKRLREAGIARGYEALRVPWFDEDALTLAVDAGLRLGEEVERAEAIELALDAPHPQASLVGHALGIEAPVQERSGPGAGFDALVAPREAPTLVLVGSAREGPEGTGGVGVALLVEPEDGVPIQASTTEAIAPLGGDAGAALPAVVEALPSGDAVRVPRSAPGQRAIGSRIEGSSTARVGPVGCAGLPLDLVAGLATGEAPVEVADVCGSRGVGLATGSGAVDVAGLEPARFPVTLDAVVDLGSADPTPWSEASQGAYVSRADYDADLEARYGARPLGEGTVATVTTIEAGPPGEFVRQHEAGGPYDVAIVEHAGGERSIHQSALPPGELAIGDRVTGVLRRLFSQEGTWRYAVKVTRG